MLLGSSIVLALITLAIAIFAQVKKVTFWGLVMVIAMCQFCPIDARLLAFLCLINHVSLRTKESVFKLYAELFKH
jgi:hypothetical protein